MSKVGRKPRPHLTLSVDCGSLSFINAAHYGGISTVTANLLEAISKIDKRNKYILYSFSKLPLSFSGHFAGRVRKVVLPRMGFYKIWMPIALRLHKPDVFLALSQAKPRGTSHTLGFIYDVAFLTHHQFYRDWKRLEQNTRILADHSCHLITTSEASKRDIVSRFGVHDKKMTVSYPGVPDLFSPHGPKYIDTRPYFLYVGGLRKSKNIPFLINAFSKVNGISHKYRLILVGSPSTQDPEILKAIKRHHLSNDVVIKGFADTNDLPKYYRGAVALVAPSLYEGFGFPILEAMSCGLPVIVGDTGSQPEVVGKAGYLISPKDSNALSEVMQQLATDEKLRSKYKKLSLQRAKQFRSERFAKDVLECIYKYCLN